MWGEHAHSTRKGLDQELAIRAELYRCRPPEKLKVPILVQTAVVNDKVPIEVEVGLVVLSQKAWGAEYLSGMRAEDLKGWHK